MRRLVVNENVVEVTHRHISTCYDKLLCCSSSSLFFFFLWFWHFNDMNPCTRAVWCTLYTHWCELGYLNKQGDQQLVSVFPAYAAQSCIECAIYKYIYSRIRVEKKTILFYFFKKTECNNHSSLKYVRAQTHSNWNHSVQCALTRQNNTRTSKYLNWLIHADGFFSRWSCCCSC